MTELVVTDGLHRYAVHKEWGQIPQNLPRGRLSQIAALPDGRVAAVQRADPAVLVFAPDGTLDTAWHHAALGSVHGICATPQGTIWITSFDLHQVLHFTPEGRLLLALGEHALPRWSAPFNHPTDVAVAADGEIYVSDGYGNACTHRFAPDGTHIASWGTPGRGAGEFTCPHGIWIDEPRRRVIVLDRDNDRACLFTRDGAWLGKWRHCFRRPMDIWSDGARFWVSDQTPAIWCLDSEGAVLGRARGLCVYPHGIWGDADGLFIAEQQPDAVTRYTRLPA